jgi:hypothetical protein
MGKLWATLQQLVFHRAIKISLKFIFEIVFDEKEVVIEWPQFAD